MTISDIGNYVTFRTGADTTAFTAANRLISTNRWYHKIVTMILGAQDEWDWDDTNRTDYPIATTSLVANQQDYNLGTTIKILKINRVEVTYDGTTWYKAEPVDINQLSIPTDTTSLSGEFTTTKPYYDVNSGSIFLYPIPTASVSGGLKIWYQREADEFTSAQVSTGTKEPGFDEPFHVMIGLGMCLDWASANGNKRLYKEVSDELKEYEARLISFYGKKNADRHIALGAAYINYN